MCRVFFDAVLNSPFRVADPEAAQFFWVPVHNGATSPQVMASVLQHIQHGLPYFNRSIQAGLPNHIIVQPADYGFHQSAWEDHGTHAALQRPEVAPGEPPPPRCLPNSLPLSTPAIRDQLHACVWKHMERALYVCVDNHAKSRQEPARQERARQEAAAAPGLDWYRYE